MSDFYALPEERAEAVLDNPSHLFEFVGEKLLPENIRVRVHGEDMEVGKALYHLLHAVMTDPSASDTLKTIAGDCHGALRDALVDHYQGKERRANWLRANWRPGRCMED